MSLIWLSSASPLFFYSPAPVYFEGSKYSAKWSSVQDPLGQAPNDTLATTFGPAAVILPSFYSESSVVDPPRLWRYHRHHRRPDSLPVPS